MKYISKMAFLVNFHVEYNLLFRKNSTDMKYRTITTNYFLIKIQLS